MRYTRVVLFVDVVFIFNFYYDDVFSVAASVVAVVVIVFIVFFFLFVLLFLFSVCLCVWNYYFVFCWGVFVCISDDVNMSAMEFRLSRNLFLFAF